jgi:hypothetical protein
MNDCAALLIPNRGFNAGRDALVVEVLDGVPAGMRALFEDVVDGVGSYDGGFEHPAAGKVPT